jgi:hypothetical protein
MCVEEVNSIWSGVLEIVKRRDSIWSAVLEIVKGRYSIKMNQIIKTDTLNTLLRVLLSEKIYVTHDAHQSQTIPKNVLLHNTICCHNTLLIQWNYFVNVLN